MDEHEPDDLLPNDGSYFMASEPEEQTIERQKEKAETLEAYHQIQLLIERIQERITFYESVSSIPDKVRTDPREFLIMHNTHTLMARTLTNEKEYIESLLEQYAPPR